MNWKRAFPPTRFPRTNTLLLVRLTFVVALFTTLFVFPGDGHAFSSEDVLRIGGTPSTTIHSPPPDSQDGPPRFSFLQTRISSWYGRSISSGAVLGKIQRGTLHVLGLRYHRLLIPTSQQARSGYDAPFLWFTTGLAAADLHIPGTATPDAFFLKRAARDAPLSTHGLGTYPLGLRLEFRQWQWIRPFIAGQTGIFYFFDAVPNDRGRNVNFAAGLGGGLRMALTDRTVLTIGYRYHHLSNGFRGSINPGLDANVLFLGVGTAL